VARTTRTSTFVALAGLAILTGTTSGPARAQASAGEQAIVDRVAAFQATADSLEAQRDARADDPEYYFELGNVYADLTQRDKAQAAYEKALELDEDYVEVLVNLASLHNETGRSDEAIELLHEAVKLRPDESKVYVNLGNAYYSKSKYYDAMQQYRKALEVDERSHEAHYQIAVAYADVGIYREAIREWQKVVELAPDTDAARSAKENIEVVEQILSRRL